MKENKTLGLMEGNKAMGLMEEIKGEIYQALSTAPCFGAVTISLHFMDGKIKRVVHKREESVIPGANSKKNGGAI
jgi:hypothetical protein